MVNSGFLNKNKYLLLTGVIILTFIIVKIPFLFLPYYWDEAWPYSAAVHTLVDNGLSFSPNAIAPDLSRGHPLVFHFLAASWMKFFGSGFVSGHCFSLFISVLLIISIYVFCKKYFSEKTGFIACLLFCTQAAFLAQSVFLLPEVLIALFTMLCFYAFPDDKKALYVVFATFLLLTKESGIVLAGTMLLWKFIHFAVSGERKFNLKDNFHMVLPLVFASGFFVLQKMQHGWFFFPHHVNLISLGWNVLTEKLPNVTAYLFIYYGRNGFSFFILAALFFLIFQRLKFSGNEKKMLLLFGCFILFFLLFSSAFFFIPRYLLCTFPPFIIAGVVIMDKFFSKFKLLYFLIFTGIATTNIFYCFHNPASGEFKYLSAVKVHKKVVAYCEKENLYDKNIFANFVLRIDLTQPCAGYLSGKPFTSVHENLSDSTDYCIFSNDEFNKSQIETLIQDNKIKLIKRFRLNYAWCEVYSRIK